MLAVAVNVLPHISRRQYKLIDEMAIATRIQNIMPQYSRFSPGTNSF